MKNLKNIFTMALVTTCMSACTGFLDIEPETTLTGKNFYKSPDDIRSALYSTYSSLRDNGLYSASIYLFGDVRSDVAFPNQTNYYANTFRHEIEKFTISANNSGNQNYWAHHYKGIIRANTVIEKGKELFGNDEAVQKYIAEAEVLRALFYFNLVRAYGGVPIIMDIPQEYTDSRGHLRASTEEVYIRILTDLTTAIESNNLYRSTNNGEKTPTGRVNKYAAEALLGKVLLSMPNDITEAAYPNVEAWKDISANPNITVFYPETTTTQYEAAKYYLEDVINNGGYELYPNFSELFKPTNKHSSESIWEVDWAARSTLFSHPHPMHPAIKPTQTDISHLPFQIKEMAHAHRPDILWTWQRNGIPCIPIINMKYANSMMLSTPIHASATVTSN